MSSADVCGQETCQEIPFNVAPNTGEELSHISQAIKNNKICGDGPYTKKCNDWIQQNCNTQKALLTTSGTSALEMSVLLAGIGEGDEVILPSFTFSSTATSCVLAGATCVFVDVHPATMNISPECVEAAITDKTKAIMAVHYAGVSCDMDALQQIANAHNLFLIEDAAQGVMSSYKGKPLGSIGDFGCFSFHETKNYSMGEGGALLIRDNQFNEGAEILREKGTNRSNFLRGAVDKYTWVGYGSSYLPSDLNAAHLYPQLLQAHEINNDRLETWNFYYNQLSDLASAGEIELPYIPEYCTHNAHMFYIKLANLAKRDAFISFMRDRDIWCVFHYVPLHSSPAGLKFGRFHGEDRYTTSESDRLVRLPMFYGITKSQRERVVSAIYEFFAE